METSGGYSRSAVSERFHDYRNRHIISVQEVLPIFADLAAVTKLWKAKSTVSLRQYGAHYQRLKAS